MYLYNSVFTVLGVFVYYICTLCKYKDRSSPLQIQPVSILPMYNIQHAIICLCLSSRLPSMY